MRLPARAARQLPDQSTTLRVESSSTDDPRLRGALPITRHWLFDHLVSAGDQRRRHGEAEGRSGLEVDHELELDRCLHRQFAGAFTFENTIDIRCSATKNIKRIDSV